ncbi:MAG: hypothetical protein ORN52_11415 [Beijerinckiaceae bacterium]|jgi:hypothetical protein|nr:hypothetical protein [Beijerinckiaceae bacterium]
MGDTTNWAFRLSLTDQWAATAFIDEAQKRSMDHIGVIIPNTAWGRSKYFVEFKVKKYIGYFSILNLAIFALIQSNVALRADENSAIIEPDATISGHARC